AVAVPALAPPHPSTDQPVSCRRFVRNHRLTIPTFRALPSPHSFRDRKTAPYASTPSPPYNPAISPKCLPPRDRPVLPPSSDSPIQPLEIGPSNHASPPGL